MPLHIFENPPSLEDRIIADNHPNMEVDRIVFEKGIFIYLKGCIYPHKGLPTKEAIQAINVVKRTLRVFSELGWRLMLLLPPQRAQGLLVRLSWPIMEPYILKYDYLTPTGQGIYDLLKPQGEQFAKLIAHIFEYDRAYRYRLMDLASETTVQELVINPRKEILRLLQLNKERDYKEVNEKLSKVVTLCTYPLLYPPYKKSFIKAIQSIDFAKLQWDESDKWWAQQQTDYNYFGKTYAERQRSN